MNVRIGINPISWTNDDLPALGGETPLATALTEGKAIGYEGFAPMRTRDADQDDLVGRPERTYAVDHERIGDRPARLRVVDDRAERLFRHAGVMLERHGRDRRIGVDVAHGADKSRDCAHRAIGAAQGRKLAADIEILRLDPDRHVSVPARPPEGH